ncbi:Clan CA, family C19, ubiquitin hydrolase-like cysteine peptidase [Tritrichomonas foetus]|uniref:ubiquitinyl hydrolase 1 n=1 Tax=Tritrichomonas foetus TaxID=1144522 RepID=A0A1J4KK71_9EUKA|nr:Clan CA, family C19, ubiquitin hydrolase-like cysteine peptidase [Tritrichomonas foetus]|eukprot:OHT11697.1 Clan CA, family C19, ubiquitin hydrolase-like cysteine peptidase [Tritrichomonas foetus]
MSLSSSSSSDDFHSNKKRSNEMLDKKLPNHSTQVQIIENLKQSTSLIPGESAYLISSSWYSLWKNGIYANNNRDICEISCGKIDNRNLFDDEENSPARGIKEHDDFVIITKEVWNQLYEWYGGGPAIKVPIVGSSAGPKPILKFVNLKALYDNEEKTIQTHKYELIGDLKIRLLELFGLSKETESQVVDYWQNNFHVVLSDDKQVKDCNLYNNQAILLDVKDDEDNWKSDKLKAKNTYSHSSSYGYPSYSNRSYNGYSNYGYGYGYGRSYNYGKAPAPGVVGLSNLGNTCFFNSGTQCIIHSIPIMKIFLHSNWKADLNETNPIGMKGNLARAFADLVKNIWSGDSAVIAPHDLKMTIGQFAPQFSGYGQQDSHELITFLLDGLHEDLNRCKEKPIIDSVFGDGTNDKEISVQSWDNFKKRNDSVIVDTFYGQYRSELFCPECNSTTVVFDPYVAVSLPISKQSSISRTLIFIPFDFTQEPRKLIVTIPSNATFEIVSKEVSKNIGREVFVVVGYGSYYNSVTWSIDDNTYSTRSMTYYAFEVPEEYREKFLIPCSIRLNVRSYANSSWSSPTDIAGPFLIPVEDINATEEDIAESAANVLKAIWEKCDKPLTDKLKDVVEKIETPEQFDEEYAESKFKATIPHYYYETSSVRLKCDANYENLSSKLIYLEMNPNFMTPESGFSYESLLKNTIEENDQNESNDSANIDLSQCFQFFASPDKLDADNQWFCPKCRQFVCADKKMDIWKVPKCLIIHLKRFISTAYTTRKDETFVSFPEILDLKPYIAGPQKDEEELKYKLYAVSEHSGVMGGGHYTAHAVVVQDGHVNGSWYDFNDSSVSRASFEDTQNSEAYVLFYQRIDPNEVSDAEDNNNNDDENNNENNNDNDSNSSSDENVNNNYNNCHYINTNNYRNNNRNTNDSDTYDYSSSSSSSSDELRTIQNNHIGNIHPSTTTDSTSSSDVNDEYNNNQHNNIYNIEPTISVQRYSPSSDDNGIVDFAHQKSSDHSSSNTEYEEEEEADET